MTTFLTSNNEINDLKTFIFVVLAVTLVVCFIIILIAKATAKPQNSNSALTPEQEDWLNTIKRLFYENKALSFLEVYVACGMPREIAYSKNHNAILEYFPFNNKNIEHEGYSLFIAYQFALNERYNLQYSKLYPIDPANYGLNLNKEEIIYYRINNVILHQEKTTNYNFSYTGIRWQSGPLRMGTLSVLKNEITRFTPIDIGRLFITNKRILFIGKQKNVTKAISIASVLHYNVYQNGILVNIPNRKPLLFKFELGYFLDTNKIGDGVHQFILALNRIISGTEALDINTEPMT